MSHPAGSSSSDRYNGLGLMLEVYDDNVKIPLTYANSDYYYAAVTDTDKVISTNDLTFTMKLPSIPEEIPLTGTAIFIIQLCSTLVCIAPTGKRISTYEGSYSISEADKTVTFTVPIANKTLSEIFGTTEIYIYNGTTFNAGDYLSFYALPYVLRK